MAQIEKGLGSDQRLCQISRMQGYQIYTSIKALMDWDNPSPDEKRQAVTQVLNSVFTLVDTVKSAMVELKEVGVNLSKIRKACGKWMDPEYGR